MSQQNEHLETGQRILSAVERIVDDSENLIAQVEMIRQELLLEEDMSEDAVPPLAARRIIASYSTRSAVAGAITALPAVFPGGGTAVAVVGGALADMAWMMKHEVEMALCLSYLYGYDIRDEENRWIGYLLAAVSTYELQAGRNYFLDLAEVQLEAITKYTPRQMSKIVISVLGKIALVVMSRNMIKALPLVGIVVSASTNKLLTQAVGWRCVNALALRRKALEEPESPVIDAVVVPVEDGVEAGPAPKGGAKKKRDAEPAAPDTAVEATGDEETTDDDEEKAT